MSAKPKGHIKNGEIVEFRISKTGKLYKGRVEHFTERWVYSPVYTGGHSTTHPAKHTVVLIAVDGEPIPQPRNTHERKRMNVLASILDRQNPNAARTKE